MEADHRHGEPVLEPMQCLGRQANFRHQHQGLAPQAQAALDGLQIDFGFTAAGDPLQQQGAKAGPGVDRLQGQALFIVQGQWALRQNALLLPVLAPGPVLMLLQQAFFLQPLQTGGADAKPL